MFQIERGNLLMGKTNFIIKSMLCRTLIFFLLISNPRAKKLYVFEDNEAVIKMILKGRSPTMRHVSRTHRVALDWLFDRINLDPTDPNQIYRHQEPTGRHLDKGEFHT